MTKVLKVLRNFASQVTLSLFQRNFKNEDFGVRRVGLQLITLLIITFKYITYTIFLSFLFLTYNFLHVMYIFLIFSNLVNILVFLDNLYLFFNICRSYHHSKIHLKQCSTTLHSSIYTEFSNSQHISSRAYTGIGKGGCRAKSFFSHPTRNCFAPPFFAPPLIWQNHCIEVQVPPHFFKSGVYKCPSTI